MTTTLEHKPKLKSLTESELYNKIESYLRKNYLFRTFEIDQLLEENKTNWINKNSRFVPNLDPSKTAEQLWHDGELENWNEFKPATIEMLYDDFVWECLSGNGKSKKRKIKVIINDIITSGLIERILFNPIIKDMVSEGRTKVAKVRSLSYWSGKREKIELSVGDRCYICWHQDGMANPAMVHEKYYNAYRLLFFTNCGDNGETTKPNINFARFLTVQKDEIGLSPKQAVLQKFR